MVVVKNVVVVLRKVINIIVFGVNFMIGDMWYMRKIFVVIMVVVWMRVDIGVGFFIVLGNYVCRINCVDFFIVLINSRKVIRLVVF